MQQHRESHEHREAYTGKTEKETRPNLLAREPSRVRPTLTKIKIIIAYSGVGIIPFALLIEPL